MTAMIDALHDARRPYADGAQAPVGTPALAGSLAGGATRQGRAERILRLADLLTGNGVTRAEDLAGALGVSVRTVYRDVALLRAQGVSVLGDAGVGYRLTERRSVPAMSLTVDEADALALGLRMVFTWGDPDLSEAAAALHARLPDALRPDARRTLQHAGVVAPFSSYHVAPPAHLPVLRHATRERRRLRVTYVDAESATTHRIVRPLSVAFFAPVWILTVWCELREDFRNLRAERITRIAPRDRFDYDPGHELRDYVARPA